MRGLRRASSLWRVLLCGFLAGVCCARRVCARFSRVGCSYAFLTRVSFLVLGSGGFVVHAPFACAETSERTER